LQISLHNLQFSLSSYNMGFPEMPAENKA